jgi:hypothetical protein
MSFRSLAVCTAYLVLLGTGAVAYAEDSITVRLKNGGAVRGELVETVPNEKIVLKLATGEVRTIPWAQLAGEPAKPETPQEGLPPKVPGAETAPTDMPQPLKKQPAKPVVTASAPASEANKTGTHIHIESTHENSALYRVVGVSNATTLGGRGSVAVSLEHTERVCAAPCDTEVRYGDEYFVDAPGMTKSDKFYLAKEAQDLKVSGGNAALRGLGTAGAAVGVALLGVGTILFALSPKSEPSSESGRTVSLAVATSGVVLLIAGLGLFFTNDTSVKASPRAIAKAPKPSLSTSGFLF